MDDDATRRAWQTGSGEVLLSAGGLTIIGALGHRQELPWHEYRGLRWVRGGTIELLRAHDAPLVLTGVVDGEAAAESIQAAAQAAWSSGQAYDLCVRRMLGLGPGQRLTIEASESRDRGDLSPAIADSGLFLLVLGLCLGAWQIILLAASLSIIASVAKLCADPREALWVDGQGLRWQGRGGQRSIPWPDLLAYRVGDDGESHGGCQQLSLRTRGGTFELYTPCHNQFYRTLDRLIELNRVDLSRAPGAPIPDTALSPARLTEEGSERGLSQLDG